MHRYFVSYTRRKNLRNIIWMQHFIFIAFILNSIHVFVVSIFTHNLILRCFHWFSICLIHECAMLWDLESVFLNFCSSGLSMHLIKICNVRSYIYIYIKYPVVIKEKNERQSQTNLSYLLFSISRQAKAHKNFIYLFHFLKNFLANCFIMYWILYDRFNCNSRFFHTIRTNYECNIVILIFKYYTNWRTTNIRYDCNFFLFVLITCRGYN